MRKFLLVLFSLLPVVGLTAYIINTYVSGLDNKYTITFSDTKTVADKDVAIFAGGFVLAIR